MTLCEGGSFELRCLPQKVRCLPQKVRCLPQKVPRRLTEWLAEAHTNTDVLVGKILKLICRT